MQITPNRYAVCHMGSRLTGDAAQCFANLPWQNHRGDDGTDEFGPLDYGRRLIYGGVNFVIGSLGAVGLRDGGNAHHRSHQEKNERQNSSPHRDASVGVTIAASPRVVKDFVDYSR
jgi:hypothetical protein